MELKRIASYLTGNFPPYYQESLDKSIFVWAVRAISNGKIKKEDTDEMREYSKNDEEFFYMWLNRLFQIDEVLLDALFKNLKLTIPDDVMFSSIKKTDVESTSIQPKEKINPDKVITQYIHESLKWIFASALDIKKYDWLAFESVKEVNERLHAYAINRWIWDFRENDVVNKLFESDKNFFGFDKGSATGIAQNDWLKALMNGLFSYFRNPMWHEKGFIKTKEEFIQLLMYITMLLNILDEKKIK
jgi:hypothetical protein